MEFPEGLNKFKLFSGLPISLSTSKLKNNSPELALLHVLGDGVELLLGRHLHLGLGAVFVL